MSKKLKKGAMCTDIHFGKKMNSEVHNEDCLNYLDWFCENVKNDPSIDHVWFLGDWNEQRAAINGLTLKYSYAGAKKLNELGLPVYFLLGNHHFSKAIHISAIYSLNSHHILFHSTLSIILAPHTKSSTYHCQGFLSFKIIGNRYFAILFLLHIYFILIIS